MTFAHERLTVYQKALDFVAWAGPILEQLPSGLAAKKQLDRSSTSIPLNIAEGNAKASSKDRARFWRMALGSTLESAAVLDILVARGLVAQKEIEDGKALLEEVSAMLMALLDGLGVRIGKDGGQHGGEERERERGRGR